MEYHNRVALRITGRTALFSDPITRAGGEKCSYQVPTYQALKGMLESVYWKPTFQWRIDAVRVMNPIRSQSKGIRPIEYHKAENTLSIYTYLADVDYQVQAHFEWNLQRPELTADRNEHKHFQIAQRMIEKGGRRDVFLGARECQAYVEPCAFGEGSGAYDEVDEMAFGLMFHGFDYPDEQPEGLWRARFWYPKMTRGVIAFCAPEDCSVTRVLRPGTPKAFQLGDNLQSCGDLLREEGL